MENINNYGSVTKLDPIGLVNGVYTYETLGKNVSNQKILVSIGLSPQQPGTTNSGTWQPQSKPWLPYLPQFPTAMPLPPPFGNTLPGSKLIENVVLNPGESFCSSVIFDSRSNWGLVFSLLSEETPFSQKTGTLKSALELWQDIKEARLNFDRVSEFWHNANWENNYLYWELTGKNYTELPKKVHLDKKKTTRVRSLKNLSSWKMGSLINNWEELASLGLPQTLLSLVVNVGEDMLKVVPRDLPALEEV